MIRLRDTVIPLLLAPLAGATVIACWEYPRQGRFAILAGLATAPVCYVAQALLVFPVLCLWPQSRSPSLLVGAVWGALVAWCAGALLVPGIRDLRPVVFAGVGSAGVASGIVYALLVRSRSH